MILPPNPMALRNSMRPSLALMGSALLCSMAINLHAQSVAPAADGGTSETITLSPFVITADDTQGWQATNTLAGTRLRTNLKDLASPISVMTPELLKDLGATNVQQALLYSVNVENESEYAPDDVNGNSVANTNQNRIRGMAAGSATRGFFPTRFRMDTYNTEGLSIASGPNAILFGIGSPAGIIDSNPNPAYANRTFGSVSYVTDNNQTWRYALDFNLPIIKDKLAIRADYLKQDQETWRKPEFDKETRKYVALKAQPFPGTTIRASYEHMNDDRIHAQQSLMADQVSQWITSGKPIYNANNNQWSLDAGKTWVTRSDLNNWTYTQAVNYAGWQFNDRVFIQSGNLGGNATQGLAWKGGAVSWDPTNLYTGYNTFKDGSIVDPKVNYFGLGDLTQLHGEDKNVIVDQKITDDIFAELAYNKETDSRWQTEPYRYGISSIRADVNYYLPGTTTLNPNVGRYFTEGSSLVMISPTTLETKRAMITYSPDFAKHGKKWLGHYNFGLMYSKDTTDQIQVQDWLMNKFGSAYDLGTTNNTNFIVTRSYLSIPALGGDVGGVSYPGSFVAPTWPSQMSPNSGSSTPYNVITDSAVMGVAQGYLLNDNLVLTYGMRHDRQDVHAYAYTGTDRLSGSLTDDNSSAAASAAGLSGVLGTTSDSGTTRTLGAVWHTPLNCLSLIYNRSNEFNPQNQLVDLSGKALSASTGVGQDYGIQLNLLHDTLTLKLTTYKNTDNHASTGQNYISGPGGFGDYWMLPGLFNWGSTWTELTSLTNAQAAAAGLPAAAQTLARASALNPPGFNYSYNLSFTRSEVSNGNELEAFYKPTSNWDMRLTVANMKTQNNVYYPEMIDFITKSLPIWKQYYAVSQDWNWGGVPAVDPGTTWMTDPASVGYAVNHNALPELAFLQAMQGRYDDRVRKWRVNYMTTYHFADEALKGFSLGGAWRWRSAAVIGYKGIRNAYLPDDPTAYMPDITKPVMGPSVSFLDAWVGYQRDIPVGGRKYRWSCQLNVQNVFNDHKIVITSINHDAAGSPSSYMEKDPIKLTLTNTFSF